VAEPETGLGPVPRGVELRRDDPDQVGAFDVVAAQPGTPLRDEVQPLPVARQGEVVDPTVVGRTGDLDAQERTRRSVEVPDHGGRLEVSGVRRLTMEDGGEAPPGPVGHRPEGVPALHPRHRDRSEVPAPERLDVHLDVAVHEAAWFCQQLVDRLVVVSDRGE